MLGEDAFPGRVAMARLTERIAEQARRYATVRNETVELEDAAALRRMLERNPVAAWTDGKGTGGVAWFTYDGQQFATAPLLDVPDGILRGWFGEEAGRPARADRVVFERRGDEYVMAPLAEEGPDPGPPLRERCTLTS
jgi:hypothetical protein